MKTKDLLTTMSLESYIKEIMKIPLAEDCKAYNRRQGEIGSGARSAVITKKLGTYRSLCLKEKRLRLQIAEFSAHIMENERSENPVRASAAKREKTKLRGMFMELGKLTGRKRELEDAVEKIPNEFVRTVITHRYFEDIGRRLPTWSETAKELGIAVSGEELRTYISFYLTDNFCFGNR